MQALTSKQAQVLAYIQRRVQRTGQAPSYREIAAHLGVTVRTAYQHVQALERKGVLTRARRHHGLPFAADHLPPTGLPLVGRVAAGTPILATEHIAGYLEIDRLLADRSTLFALQVKGDSMVDRQSHEGDYVIVRTQPWVEHGDIGVIAIEEAITVKTVLRRRTGVWLKPENQHQGYPMIRLRPDQRVRLVGKVLVVFRLVSA
jgi:repressor LexA